MPTDSSVTEHRLEINDGDRVTFTYDYWFDRTPRLEYAGTARVDDNGTVWLDHARQHAHPTNDDQRRILAAAAEHAIMIWHYDGWVNPNLHDLRITGNAESPGSAT